MTKLMVSVTNAAEATLALECGADMIDVKEPRRGPLGPADPKVWREVRTAIGPDATLGVALGELQTDRVTEVVSETGCANYFKIGLSHSSADWQSICKKAFSLAPQGPERVAV